MPGCIVSATTASFISVENRRRRATPVITSTFENVSDIGVCLGLSLGPPAIAGVRSKQGAVQGESVVLTTCCGSPGILKISPLGRQFFAHKARPLNCDWNPESPEHLELKA